MRRRRSCADLIGQHYPQHGIVGEEYGTENDGAEFVWVLDPIDGTISFASGCPLFGTLIGLLHEGEAGVWAPSTSRFWNSCVSAITQAPR